MTFDLSAFLLTGTLLSIDSDHVLLGWGKRSWRSSPIGEQPNFYYPDFFLKTANPWFTQEFWTIINPAELLSLLPDSSRPSLDWVCTDKSIFESAFTDLQNLFEKGRLDKAVPYIFERTSVKFSQSLLSHLLQNTISYSQNCPVYVYGMWADGEGILGATPEILFDYDAPFIKTVACAGTYSAGKFTIDPKTIHEHQLVVQGIREALDVFGNVNAGEMGYREFGALGHLVTPIELILETPCDFLGLVKALHPTPALGAFPREAGLRWLERYQTHVSRGRFGAPLGYVYRGKSRCVVAIRNVQWDAKGLSIGAGCGVVSASRVEDEWNELQLKLNTIKGFLGL